MKQMLKMTLIALLSSLAAMAADEAWFGAPIPASGEDGREDCGMTALFRFSCFVIVAGRR